MADAKSPEDELRRVMADVGWLKESARQAEAHASIDLVARCTILAATLGLLLVCSVPWGFVEDDSDVRLTGWGLVEYWTGDDVDLGLASFIARYLMVTVIVATIPGLCVLVPLPKVLGVVVSVLLWLLTIGMGLTVLQNPGRLEVEFAGTAWIAVIIMGATASSWSWWTACTASGWWRPKPDRT